MFAMPGVTGMVAAVREAVLVVFEDVAHGYAELVWNWNGLDGIYVQHEVVPMSVDNTTKKQLAEQTLAHCKGQLRYLKGQHRDAIWPAIPHVALHVFSQ